MKTFLFTILTIFLMTTITWAAEVTIPKPSGNLNLQIGHPSTISLYDVPTQMTHERLNKQGWSVKSVEFTRTDFNTMQYQATIDDPGAYTAPWTTSVFTMRWTANSDLFEYICQDNNHGPELMIGSQEGVDRSRQFVP